MAADTAYRGKQSMLKDCAATFCRLTPRHHPTMNQRHSKPRESARLCRFLSGHFPHGAYRVRFRLPGPTACLCGASTETAEHILFDCPLWLRPDAFATAARPLSSEDIRTFLRINPIAATFEWTDLLASAIQEENEPNRHLTDTPVSTHLAEIWRHTLGKGAAFRAWQHATQPATTNNICDMVKFTTQWHAPTKLASTAPHQQERDTGPWDPGGREQDGDGGRGAQRRRSNPQGRRTGTTATTQQQVASTPAAVGQRAATEE